MRKGLVLAVGTLCLVAAPGEVWARWGDRYVRSLNEAETRAELGLKEVRRPERVTNRLDVVFEEGTGPLARSRILRRIAREFIRELFFSRRIPVVSVVERTASGEIQDWVNIRVLTPLLGRGRSPGSC